MDFTLSDEQQSLVKACRQFARERIDTDALSRIKQRQFDPELWLAASEFGFAGFPIPTNYGGTGLNALDTMIMFEALGKETRDIGLAFSLAAHTFAATVPVWRFGDQFLKDTYLLPMTKGRLIAANAATEPDAGSDIYAMKATAKKVDGGYCLNGQKCFITNAPVADIFLIYAKTAPEQSFFGVSAFLVKKGTQGLTVGSAQTKHSLPTSTWGDVFLDDLFVPIDHRVGHEGAGGAIFHDSMIWEKGCLFALYVGAMERMLNMALSHAKERKQFGQAIGQFQSISNKIIDMQCRLDAARLLLYRAGWLYDQGKPCETEIAMSKLYISESVVQSSLDLIQLFGAAGIDPEMGIIQILLDALPARIFSGTNEIQREIIARNLGLRTGS